MVLSAAFSPDGRWVATSSRDRTARVWEVETGKPVGPPLQDRSPINSATFSPDGRFLVTASDAGSARVWEANTGKPVGLSMEHQDRVWSAVFSPDGRRVLTAANNGGVVWEAMTGKPIGFPLLHERGGLDSAEFSPDGRRALTAAADGTARIWWVLLGVDSGQDADLLADLAEVAGGYRVNDFGSILTIEDPPRSLADLRRRIAGLPDRPGGVAWFARRFLPAPQASR